MTKIIFTNTSDFEGLEKPQPASQSIPDWYKKLQSYMGDKKAPTGAGGSNGSAKKCMPLFDAIVSGYILVTPADIYVSIKDGVQWFQWADFDLISFHPVEQVQGHPDINGHPFPKLINPWSIETPKGYSILITGPMHRDLPFNVMPGIIDTDKYPTPVNVIFSMKDPNFEGFIPKGTPFAQVLPFKREPWKMEFGGKKAFDRQKNVFKLLRTKFFDSYKTQFWSRKEYK